MFNLKSLPVPGRYRHYKGQEYQVIGLVKHSETGETLVVYQALYGERGYWVRPCEMFCESVEVDGESCARFALIEPAAATDLQF